MVPKFCPNSLNSVTFDNDLEQNDEDMLQLWQTQKQLDSISLGSTLDFDRHSTEGSELLEALRSMTLVNSVYLSLNRTQNLEQCAKFLTMLNYTNLETVSLAFKRQPHKPIPVLAFDLVPRYFPYNLKSLNLKSVKIPSSTTMQLGQCAPASWSISAS